MKQFNLIVLAIVLIGLSCARVAQQNASPVNSAPVSDGILSLSDGAPVAAAPATQPAAKASPALPSGHPDISALRAAQAAKGLPAGHPAVPSQGQAASAQPAAAVETTTQEPDWFVHMRHIMLTPTDKGLQVIDMLAIENPSEKAWVGRTDSAGHNVTFTVELPVNATEVKVANGFGTDASIDGAKVINNGALPPGNTQYRLQYTVPLIKGAANLSVTAPGPVSSMMVFYPDDGATLTATGMKGPETVNMGNGNTRYFKADDIGVGHEVKISIGGAKAASPSTLLAPPLAAGESFPVATGNPPQAAGLNGAELAKSIAGVGAVLIFLLGGALMLIKPKTAKKH